MNENIVVAFSTLFLFTVLFLGGAMAYKFSEWIRKTFIRKGMQNSCSRRQREMMFFVSRRAMRNTSRLQNQ